MTLLLVNLFICLKDLINNPGKRIKLGTDRLLLTAVSLWNRKHHHLVNCTPVNAKIKSRLPATYSFNKD